MCKRAHKGPRQLCLPQCRKSLARGVCITAIMDIKLHTPNKTKFICKQIRDSRQQNIYTIRFEWCGCTIPQCLAQFTSHNNTKLYRINFCGVHCRRRRRRRRRLTFFFHLQQNKQIINHFCATDQLTRILTRFYFSLCLFIFFYSLVYFY